MKRFLLLLLFAGAAGTLWFVTPHGLERDLCRTVRGVDAEVGIAVVREGRVIASVGGDRPMPAMSTFKFPLGAGRRGAGWTRWGCRFGSSWR